MSWSRWYQCEQDVGHLSQPQASSKTSINYIPIEKLGEIEIRESSWEKKAITGTVSASQRDQ